jgi:hypothetical protein
MRRIRFALVTCEDARGAREKKCRSDKLIRVRRPVEKSRAFLRKIAICHAIKMELARDTFWNRFRHRNEAFSITKGLADLTQTDGAAGN